MKLNNYFGTFNASASLKQYGRRQVSRSIDELFMILSEIYVTISLENLREVSNVFIYLNYLIPGNWPSKQASR